MLLAIDPGTTSLGFARFDDEDRLIQCGNFAAVGERLYRSLSIASAVEYMSKDCGFIAIEEPVLRGHASKAMNRLIGMFEYMFKTRDLYYYNPLTVKAAMGSSKLTKEELAKRVWKTLNDIERGHMKSAFMDRNYDAIDAIAVGLTHYKKLKEKK